MYINIYTVCMIYIYFYFENGNFRTVISTINILASYTVDINVPSVFSNINFQIHMYIFLLGAIPLGFRYQAMQQSEQNYI